jgi:putative membrane protein
MKIVIIDNKKNKRINAFLDWLIYMIGYALVLIAVSLIFKNTVQIDNSYFGIWGLAAAIIIYYLNKTIKPVLIWLTLPITGLTLGLFYPFINVFILNIVDFILGDYFTINGIWMSFLVAIFISIMNAIMEEVIVKSIINKGDRYE